LPVVHTDMPIRHWSEGAALATELEFAENKMCRQSGLDWK